jgi:hypothetical protein
MATSTLDSIVFGRTGRPALGSQVPAGSMVAAGRRSGSALRAMTDRPRTAVVANRAPAATTTGAPRPGQVRLPDGFGYAMVDALVNQVPVGFYALPKRDERTGNDVTFFEVSAFRGGHRIQMLSGAPGAYQQHPMKLPLQWFAARHLLEDLVAATALYGIKAQRCGRCHSPLTRTKSRAQGMGDHCMNERAAGR